MTRPMSLYVLDTPEREEEEAFGCAGPDTLPILTPAQFSYSVAWGRR
jgi:hypothetical protein